MEAFITDDGSVAKFIHRDGSETAIKVVKSCSNFRDPTTGRIKTEWVDRRKYSVFISASLGCYMRCKFCHLTIKGSAYRKLQAEQVVANVKEAIIAEVARRPEIRERYVKLCWMGMGDAVNQPEMVVEATLELMDWLMANDYAKGLDCVDLSTVLPAVGDDWIEHFVRLNRELERYPINPESFRIEQAKVATHKQYEHRTRFRLFYSLHSAVQTTRELMVPNALPLSEAVPLLKRFAEAGPNLLLHTVFVEGLNDGLEEVGALLTFVQEHFPENELRVLRYNHCDRSPYREMHSLDQALVRLADGHARFKLQTSAGKEVSAACGQFLVAIPRALQRRSAVGDVRRAGA
jgi:adenine C2-methylase RlmN of 23S rRNA A2503 and tRNA A37